MKGRELLLDEFEGGVLGKAGPLDGLQALGDGPARGVEGDRVRQLAAVVLVKQPGRVGGVPAQLGRGAVVVLLEFGQGVAQPGRRRDGQPQGGQEQQQAARAGGHGISRAGS